jgi:para-nitrobenzyl esterase
MTSAIDPTAPVVATGQGRVRGTVEGGIAVFRGIPYAEPPVGSLRFRPPARREPWEGVREATRFGPCHPQYDDPVEGRFMVHASRPPQAEDCLSLNVWTPDVGAGGLPVLVWIHGGSLKHGTGADAIYNGATFAREGIVTVTINYRLHPAGYLYVGDRPGSGAFGLLDQIAALEWVQENIAAFGGDPHAVTVAGESAGAHSVGSLLAAPAAEGLFRRGVLQSGAASFEVPAEMSTVIGDAVLARVGARRDDAQSLATISSADLLDASREVEARMFDVLAEHGVAPNLMTTTTCIHSMPTYGTEVLPDRALEAVAGGSARGVDLLIGTNVDEVTMFGPDYLALAAPVSGHAFGSAAAEALERYGGDRTRLLTDALFRIPAIRLADAAQAHNEHTYMYLLTYASPPTETTLGAMHGLDLAFMWDMLGDPAGPIRDAVGGTLSPSLATAMHGAWAAFVKTRAPQHPTLPEWPAYDGVRRATMQLDDACEVVDDPMGQDRALWKPVRY